MSCDNCHPLATHFVTRSALIAKRRKPRHIIQRGVERARRHEAARLTGGAATISAVSFTPAPTALLSDRCNHFVGKNASRAASRVAASRAAASAEGTGGASTSESPALTAPMIGAKTCRSLGVHVPSKGTRHPGAPQKPAECLEARQVDFSPRQPSPLPPPPPRRRWRRGQRRRGGGQYPRRRELTEPRCCSPTCGWDSPCYPYDRRG